MYLRSRALLFVFIFIGTITLLLLYAGSIQRRLQYSMVFEMFQKTSKSVSLNPLSEPLKTALDSPKLVLLYTPFFGRIPWDDIPYNYQFTGKWSIPFFHIFWLNLSQGEFIRYYLRLYWVWFQLSVINLAYLSLMAFQIRRDNLAKWTTVEWNTPSMCFLHFPLAFCEIVQVSRVVKCFYFRICLLFVRIIIKLAKQFELTRNLEAFYTLWWVQL